MKEFVRHRIQRLFVHARIGQRARLDNLRRGQVLHAITRVTIIRKMNQKGVSVEFGRSPHRRFRPDDLLNITKQGGPLTAFVSQ